jgi:hypothetical protein
MRKKENGMECIYAMEYYLAFKKKKRDGLPSNLK